MVYDIRLYGDSSIISYLKVLRPYDDEDVQVIPIPDMNPGKYLNNVELIRADTTFFQKIVDSLNNTYDEWTSYISDKERFCKWFNLIFGQGQYQNFPAYDILTYTHMHPNPFKLTHKSYDLGYIFKLKLIQIRIIYLIRH